MILDIATIFQTNYKLTSFRGKKATVTFLSINSKDPQTYLRRGLGTCWAGSEPGWFLLSGPPALSQLSIDIGFIKVSRSYAFNLSRSRISAHNLKLILQHKSLPDSTMARRKYCFASTVIDPSFSFYFTWSRRQYV